MWGGEVELLMLYFHFLGNEIQYAGNDFLGPMLLQMPGWHPSSPTGSLVERVVTSFYFETAEWA